VSTRGLRFLFALGFDGRWLAFRSNPWQPKVRQIFENTTLMGVNALSQACQLALRNRRSKSEFTHQGLTYAAFIPVKLD
jgi:hypothetical protein